MFLSTSMQAIGQGSGADLNQKRPPLVVYLRSFEFYLESGCCLYFPVACGCFLFPI